MAWVKILPPFADPFGAWNAAEHFLEWTGVLVNHHRRRQVEQVCRTDCAEAAQDKMSRSVATGALSPCELTYRDFHDSQPIAEMMLATKVSTSHINASADESGSFFLKKEHAVTWRDRFHNAWAGFGWCATSVREATILLAARKAGVACPEVAAFGELRTRAFLLLRDEADMVELRTILLTLDSNTDRNQLAEALGRELARLHAAGFDHPDLFAKHILVGRTGPTFRICILDWARARRRRAVSWHLRCRALAILDATLHTALASDRLRLRCLRAYLREANRSALPMARLAQEVRRTADLRRRERNVRELGQLPTPPRDQQFVPACDGRLLIVRSYWDNLDGRLPTWLTCLPNAVGPMMDFTLTAANAAGGTTLRVHTTTRPAAHAEMPPLAHLLFRLQRFGVPAPRLLAVGRSPLQHFVVTEAPAILPFDVAFAKAPPSERRRMLGQAGSMIRQIHDAGHSLPPGDSWPCRLGIALSTGNVVLSNVDGLLRGNSPWQDLAANEITQPTIRLSRTEQLRFLAAYLGRPGKPKSTRRLLERQPAA